MVVYVISFALVLALSALAEWRKYPSDTSHKLPRWLGLWGFLAFLLLSSVSVLRWGVGTDYWNYYRNFSSYADQASQGVPLWEEPGIKWIALLVTYIGGDGAVMLGVAAFITTFLLVRSTWRWTPSLKFGMGIFILSGTWYGSFNGVRQYLAASILIAGHRYIIDRKPLRWGLIVILASLFHISAVIGLLFYFVPHRRPSAAGQFGIILAAIFISFGSGQLLLLVESFHHLDNIASSSYAQREVNPLRIAFAIVPIILFWIMPKPRILETKGAWFYVNMLLIYGASMLAMSTSAFLTRFVIYPQVFLAIGLAYTTEYDDQKTKNFIRFVLILLFGIFMTVEVLGSQSLSEFTWIFERP